MSDLMARVDALSEAPTVDRVKRLAELQLARDALRRQIEEEFKRSVSEIDAEIGYIVGLLRGMS